MTANGSVYAPFIIAGFVRVLVLGYVDSSFAKAVTIKNGVYTMLAVVIHSICESSENE
jgi:hypothetical protein